jgi:hypothetical protein
MTEKQSILSSYPVQILIVLGIIIIVPFVIMGYVPEIGLIFKAFLALVIFFFVQRIIGGGILTYVIAGALIYILLFTNIYWLFAPAFILYTLVGAGLTGIILFMLQKH